MSGNRRQSRAYTNFVIQERVWEACLDAGLESMLAEIIVGNSFGTEESSFEGKPILTAESAFIASMLLIRHRAKDPRVFPLAQHDLLFRPAPDDNPDKRVWIDLDRLPAGMSFEVYDGSARFHFARYSGVSREVWPIRERKTNPPGVLRGWLVPNEVLEALDDFGY